MAEEAQPAVRSRRKSTRKKSVRAPAAKRSTRKAARRKPRKATARNRRRAVAVPKTLMGVVKAETAALRKYVVKEIAALARRIG